MLRRKFVFGRQFTNIAVQTDNCLTVNQQSSESPLSCKQCSSLLSVNSKDSRENSFLLRDSDYESTAQKNITAKTNKSLVLSKDKSTKQQEYKQLTLLRKQLNGSYLSMHNIDFNQDINIASDDVETTKLAKVLCEKSHSLGTDFHMSTKNSVLSNIMHFKHDFNSGSSAFADTITCYQLDCPLLNSDLSSKVDKIGLSRSSQKQFAQQAKYLNIFKETIANTPHLRVSLDDNILQAFLKHAQFNQTKALQRLDTFCTLRTSPLNGVPNWYREINANNSCVEEFFKAGILLRLGYVSNGTIMHLFRLGQWQNSNLDLTTVRSLVLMCFDQLLRQPLALLNGIGLIIDFSGLDAARLNQFGTKQDGYFYAKLWQDAYPLQMKYIVFYKKINNYENLDDIMSFWLKQKLRSRIINCNTSIQKAYKSIKGLVDVMPIEYNGNNSSIKDIGEKQKIAFQAFQRAHAPVMLTGLISVNESLRPVATPTSNSKTYLDNGSSTLLSRRYSEVSFIGNRELTGIFSPLNDNQ